MRQQCVRAECSDPAVALVTLDPCNRVARILPLTAGTGSELCRRHTERLSVPRGWVLVDNRPLALVPRPAPPPTQDRPTALGPLPADHRRAPALPFAAPDPPTTPRHLYEADESTPMMARAFRASGRTDVSADPTQRFFAYDGESGDRSDDGDADGGAADVDAAG